MNFVYLPVAFPRIINQNFLISGGCPYHERCTYIHDARLRSDRVVIRTLPPMKTSEMKDSFFWPDLEQDLVKVTKDCYTVFFLKNISL